MDDPSFDEMIDRLRLGQELVREETERVARAGLGDHRAALWFSLNNLFMRLRIAVGGPGWAR